MEWIETYHLDMNDIHEMLLALGNALQVRYTKHKTSARDTEISDPKRRGIPRSAL